LPDEDYGSGMRTRVIRVSRNEKLGRSREVLGRIFLNPASPGTAQKWVVVQQGDTGYQFSILFLIKVKYVFKTVDFPNKTRIRLLTESASLTSCLFIT
jgi:hypothetical protein